jgi:hypothetical protein
LLLWPQTRFARINVAQDSTSPGAFAVWERNSTSPGVVAVWQHISQEHTKPQQPSPGVLAVCQLISQEPEVKLRDLHLFWCSGFFAGYRVEQIS